ncbi:hypothetical protein B0H16DRAFT_1484409 [Mycena metata]|uniref:Uncharacterized protein n=1 Tax=Mycena metata TaxID=1033252 RepID=A0AAD7DT90_9AGAR|nr:hypothetical protein B0H16DRAFT_1484409 [Mycena metata]
MTTTAKRTCLTPVQLQQFWEVSWALCTRTSIKGRWVYSPALEEWNQRDQQPCSRCTDARTPRICKITIDHPCCQNCRELKIGCDRRARFVFEHTKQDFFDDYQSFLAVYSTKPPRDMRSLKQTGNRARRLLLQAPEERLAIPFVPYPPERPKFQHKAVGNTRGETSIKKYMLHLEPELQVLKLQTVALKETAERIKTYIERTIAVESGPRMHTNVLPAEYSDPEPNRRHGTPADPRPGILCRARLLKDHSGRLSSKRRTARVFAITLHEIVALRSVSSRSVYFPPYADT